MPELFKQPSSRIVQIDGEHALCEDGSVWVQYENRQAPYMWVVASPPHKPENQYVDIEEAIEALRALFVEVKAETKACERAMGNANRVLNKFYGAIK